jgi:phosphate:Na+ symporter
MMELKTMQEKVLRMFEIATEAFDNVDTDHLNELTALENEVDGLKKELSARHYARLTEGACKVELSPYFSSVVAGLERVADHLVNVGFSILNPTGTESEEIQS